MRFQAIEDRGSLSRFGASQCPFREPDGGLLHLHLHQGRPERYSWAAANIALRSYGHFHGWYQGKIFGCPTLATFLFMSLGWVARAVASQEL